MEDICYFVIREAEKRGSEHTEAYVTKNREAEVFIENNDLKQSKLTSNVYIHLDLFVHPRRLWFQNENEIVEKIDLDKIFEKEKELEGIIQNGKTDYCSFRNSVFTDQSKNIEKFIHGIDSIF